MSNTDNSITDLGFWKYLLKTYKKASTLLIIGIATAVYLTVSSIFANQMQIAELTYFNAMLSLAYFSTMIGFGISGGMAIYINQNFKNKKAVAGYTKIGMYLTIAVLIFFVLIVIVFKDLIFKYIFNISSQSNTLFFFLMCGYILVNGLGYYFTDTLKNMKKFKFQLIQIVTFAILLISGFAILRLSNGLYLNLIGILYLFASIINLIILYVLFLKDKEYKINLLTFTKIKLTLKQFSTILYMAFSQIVWQIGYMFTSMFLLKISELYFNVYAYYENVLDMFNTLYFSFIIITSIEIARSLGENKKDEAYKHGKYSIYFSLFIWLVYAVLSLILIVPINSGLHIELQSIGTASMILYVAIHLPRFIAWNLSGYILVWGGVVKTIFWCEIISSLYYVLIFIFANHLPNSLYWTYFFIGIDSLIKIPVYLTMFKKKKWLVNLSDETETQLKCNAE